jgi:hypothetical protein
MMSGLASLVWTDWKLKDRLKIILFSNLFIQVIIYFI